MAHNHWTSYWKTGVTGSFGTKEPLWYKEVLEPFWRKDFIELPDKSWVLDIATGNGAVARLAQETSLQEKKVFTIYAADIARLSPTKQHDQIHYLPENPIEKLNLPGHQFDLITSQFGIEYSNTEAALQALKPLLKPTGEILIIAHHHDSIICKSSREELKQYKSILDQQSVFKKLISFIKSMGELKNRYDIEGLKSNQKANSQRESFNRLIAKLTKLHPDGAVLADFLYQINPLFKQKMLAPLAEKLEYIKSVQNSFQQGRQRLLDLLSATMDHKMLQKFISQADKKGFKCIHSSALTDASDQILAWQLNFSRN